MKRQSSLQRYNSINLPSRFTCAAVAIMDRLTAAEKCQVLSYMHNCLVLVSRCCKVCARVEGEPCGGLFGFSGSCADGLQCVIKNLLPNTREVDEGVCTSESNRYPWNYQCYSNQIHVRIGKVKQS